MVKPAVSPKHIVKKRTKGFKRPQKDKYVTLKVRLSLQQWMAFLGPIATWVV